MTLPAATRARLRPLVLRLGSEQPGEAAAAVAAIGRVLRSAGLDWYALADAIAPPSAASRTSANPKTSGSPATAGASAPPPPGDDDGSARVLRMVDATLRHPERLSHQEVSFLFRVATRARTGGRLSSKQEGTLRRLYHRTAAAGAAAV